MINYEVGHPAGFTVAYLKLFETDLCKFMRSLLDQDLFNQLCVKLLLTLKKRSDKETVYMITTNVSLSLKSSNAFAGKVEDYVSKLSVELNACIASDQYLEINLQFSNKDNKEDDTKTANNDLAFIPVTPRYSFNQVILPDKLKSEINEALNVIRFQNLIYQKWGFGKVDPVPKSVLNFYGPPGTGKTMCAHAIAQQLGKKLLALNYAEIESKYVGEAPKNLMKAFEIAKKEDCVMFFDEADSFLGKRIQNVTQGADQALNSLRSQMLILLEEHSGVVIFATNLVTNFDKAFESRILKHLKFDLPNKEARIAIIRSMLPEELPLSAPFTDEEFKQLGEATEGLAGREIKNAILDALLGKATKDGENATFVFADFEETFQKRQKMLNDLKNEASREKKEKIINALKKNPEVLNKSENQVSSDVEKEPDTESLKEQSNEKS